VENQPTFSTVKGGQPGAHIGQAGATRAICFGKSAQSQSVVTHFNMQGAAFDSGNDANLAAADLRFDAVADGVLDQRL